MNAPVRHLAVRQAAQAQLRDYRYDQDSQRMQQWLKQGTQKMETLTIPDTLIGVQFVTDPDYPDKIEINMVDTAGVIQEGGQFDLESFLACVLEFYNANY